MSSLNIDMDILFEGVYRKLTAEDFGKNLGGELPLFIQPIPANKQLEAESQVKRLANRLTKIHVSTSIINLYDMCIDILREEGILDTLLESEKELMREDIVATLDGVLDIKSVLIPRIQQTIENDKPQFVFITGVGSAYPFVRSHGILNNIDELANQSYLVMFFPGEYNNLQLSLFGKISDENYYRGYNLNDIETTFDTI